MYPLGINVKRKGFALLRNVAKKIQKLQFGTCLKCLIRENDPGR